MNFLGDLDRNILGFLLLLCFDLDLYLFVLLMVEIFVFDSDDDKSVDVDRFMDEYGDNSPESFCF